MNIHTDRWYSEFKLPINKQKYALLQKALVNKGYEANRYAILDPSCGSTSSECVLEKRKAELVEFYLLCLSLGADLDTVQSPSCSADSSLVLDLAGEYASLSTSLTGSNNDLVWTAKNRGSIGNLLQIQYLNPVANNAVLSVAVVGVVIRVSLATDGSGVITSTANSIISAAQASEAVSNLVSVAKKGSDTGAGVVTALAATNLTGGAD